MTATFPNLPTPYIWNCSEDMLTSLLNLECWGGGCTEIIPRGGQEFVYHPQSIHSRGNSSLITQFIASLWKHPTLTYDITKTSSTQQIFTACWKLPKPFMHLDPWPILNYCNFLADQIANHLSQSVWVRLLSISQPWIFSLLRSVSLLDM